MIRQSGVLTYHERKISVEWCARHRNRSIVNSYLVFGDEMSRASVGSGPDDLDRIVLAPNVG